MKILKAPHPVLKQKARPVKKIDAKIRRIISQMKQALKMSKIGVGLAAPQIGIPLQIFIVSYKSDKSSKSKREYQVFLNPKILSSPPPPATSHQSPATRHQQPGTRHQAPETTLEGCLSIPNIWGYVKRHPKITLTYLDEKGKKHRKTFRGFFATIIQHEADHLNGVLFTERVLSQGRKLYRQTRHPKTGEKTLEEINI